MREVAANIIQIIKLASLSSYNSMFPHTKVNIQLHNLKYHRHTKGKGKSVPLQAWTGPEGSRKLRFPDFVTTAQDGGKVVSLTHQPPLPPGNTPGTHFC